MKMYATYALHTRGFDLCQIMPLIVRFNMNRESCENFQDIIILFVCVCVGVCVGVCVWCGDDIKTF